MLARWTGVVQDDAGNAVAGASIEVRSETTGALVPVYADRDGAVALGNPFTATEATFAFHAPGDAYRIMARAGSVERVWRFVAIGTAQEYDFADLAETMQAGVYPVATRAALNAYVPEDGQAIAGVVLNDPNPANNGYYIRVGNAWSRARGLPDTLARLQVTGGTANAVQAGGSPGVDPATVTAFVIDVTTPNTGNVTLAINGGAARQVRDVRGNQFAPGQFVGRLFLTNEGTQYREIVGSDIVARAYAEAERAQAAAGVATGAAAVSTQEANRSRDEADRAQQVAGSVQFPVSYAPQTLTPEQQSQARRNVGATETGSSLFTAGDVSAVVVMLNLLPVQSDPNDTSVNVLLRQGAFGLGPGSARNLTNSQLNDPTLPTGFYRIASPSGLPAGTYAVFNNNPTGSACSQMATLVNTVDTTTYTRRRSATVSQNTEWVINFDQNSILGPVSQSGGIPTGRIIERGSNANGEYVRLADGTQIAIAIVTGINVDNNRNNGSYFQGVGNYTPPVAFTGYTFASCADASSANLWGAANLSTASLFFNQAINNRSAIVVIIGRWF